MKLMAGLVGHYMSQDGHPQQGKIPDAIQDFMPHELIRKPQSTLIHYARMIHHNNIVKGAPTPQAESLELLVFMQKTKSTRFADLFGESRFIDFQSVGLAADEGMVEIDGTGDFKHWGGKYTNRFTAGFKGDGRLHFENAP